MDPWHPNTQILLEAIRKTPIESLRNTVKDVVPLQLMPLALFIHSLTTIEQEEVLRACLMIFILSNGKMVPRQPQLVGALATLAGRNSKIILGTGSGKTLIMVLPHLLRPDRVSIVVSPLKRLQVTQVCRMT
jgi:hypothetical protein